MAEYRISGVWKNANNVITHYAFHTEGPEHISRASKVTKARAIELLETKGNSAKTMMWNYKTCRWSMGEDVIIVGGQSGKYLRTEPDSRLTDNLSHLIDYDWVGLSI